MSFKLRSNDKGFVIQTCWLMGE